MSEINRFNYVLTKLRKTSPLVHNITNYVVMNNTANALLSIGASPVMAHAIEEVEDIVAISSSLVINMGTLSKNWVDAMMLAITKAKELNKPFVFDPVGVGASTYRIETAKNIISRATPNVIRGNASEIMALAEITSTTKGVDSTVSSDAAIAAAQKLSKELNNTVVISGATDYIITQEQINEVSDGHPMMSKITGMGCTATAIIGACIAVESDYQLASTVAMKIMGNAGNTAAKISQGTGSFEMNFLDSLSNLKELQ
ncbi:hydroxyethylthiazole kinase [Bernardetia litoralis DSM 6794]|uniref:Hydroxyethylthiazole kinase n=1 Tax=Bernardetia litoralis (strain ATCC 23117 / DSM 6794 / NBRC 15988 / NCIMB 1366 / Fx l1 / Sio-4) TaxID=880071 RepID=I4AFE0_BERLS|nr:hydroxyethylthiazole kinase [Bernardetia litoralis]AFM02675.1 hydroxyethylthiazole kinase [Bernardetia litoralis DSM 6794]